MKPDYLTGWKLVLTWIAIIIVTCSMWYVVIAYICIPAAHAIGGLFRMAAIR